MGDFFKAKKPKVKSAGEEGSSKPTRVVPWVEKYRPKSVDDIAHQEEVVSVLRNTVKGNDFPNLLFYGAPGTGKTSTILAVCRQLFGHDLYKSRVLELNASDERGIQVVRDKVKNFASQSVSSKKMDGTPCPPFKVVILDEADSMTKHAQAALRRTMEKQTKTTRFCLICNYVSRIIEPITSRCAKFRFKSLTVETIDKCLKNIANQETVDIEEEALSEIITASEGDMRKAVTYLQSAHRLKSGEKITRRDVIEMAGVVPSEIIEELINVCSTGSFEKVDTKVKMAPFSYGTSLIGKQLRALSKITKNKNYPEELINEGYSASQTILQLHERLVTLGNIDDNQKSVIMEKLAVVDKCLCDGADEYLQIMAILTVVMEQLCKQ